MKALRIAELFNERLGRDHNTVLHGGAHEPLYVPAGKGAGAELCNPAKLYFTLDYPRSALHEIAHWCLAGCERRNKIDFGYRYTAPPRSQVQQERFFALELRTQALELIFCRAAGLNFSPSADNLEVDRQVISAFHLQIERTATCWLDTGVQGRAQTFLSALHSATQSG